MTRVRKYDRRKIKLLTKRGWRKLLVFDKNTDEFIITPSYLNRILKDVDS